jgi:hypothetical protein
MESASKPVMYVISLVVSDPQPGHSGNKFTRINSIKPLSHYYRRNSMKRILALSAIVFLVALSQHTTANAQNFLGPGLVLWSQGGTEVGIEAHGVFNLKSAPNLAISPDLQYFFIKDATVIGINGNLHYNFVNFRGGGGAYALGGLHILTGFGDARLGLNLGAGVMGDLGGVNAYGDLKLILGGSLGTPLVISAGLLFPL